MDCSACARRFESAPTEAASEAVQRVLVSTKVCSFGEQVLEKKETETGVPPADGGRRPGVAQFRFERAPLCEYMVNFIGRLRSLPDRQMMNSVLENFTIFQVRLTLLKLSCTVVCTLIYS